MADDVNDTEPGDTVADDLEAAPTDEATDAATTDDADAATTEDADEAAEEERVESEAKKKADAVIAERRAKTAPVGERKVERRVVTSRRVTPKPGAKPAKDDAPVATSKARDAKKTEAVVSRTPPVQERAAYAKGPSPWWVPALMFGLIILGGLTIMLNYMGAFGEPDNTRLVLGLGLILGGIITATQYR
jgi:hypothetical protein